MKIFIKDIRGISWLDQIIKKSKWGSAFYSIANGGYFLFYHDMDDFESNFTIKYAEKAFTINERIYREQARLGTNHVSYIREPFDTSNQIIYKLLDTFICEVVEDVYMQRVSARKALGELFEKYKVTDILESKGKVAKALKGTYEVGSRISFESSLGNFFINKKPFHGVIMVTDLIDKYVQNKRGLPLYGNYLTSIVRAVKNPNGGLIPVGTGGMRYFIIGERAAGNDPMLARAKELFRGHVDDRSIYLETGWYYNRYDLKWRKRLPDHDFKVKKINHNGDGSFVVKPSKDIPVYSNGENLLDNLIEISGSNSSVGLLMIADGYEVRYSDIFDFEELERLYPSLKDVYFFFAGSTHLKNQFYYSSSNPKMLVLLSNIPSEERLKYIALHELQHFIQNVEGFSNGGNPSLGNIVNTSGGDTTRKFILALNGLIKKFTSSASSIDFDSVKKLYGDLQNISFPAPYEAEYVDFMRSLKQMTVYKSSFETSCENFAVTLLNMYTFFPDSKGLIEKFITDSIGAEYMDVYNQCLINTENKIKSEEYLIKQGWNHRDFNMLNFQTYLALVGEMESRFVQGSNRMPESLQDYFELYSGETLEKKRITSIGVDLSADNINAEAGIELNNGKYIIHLSDKYSNTIDVLHEFGHIIHDVLTLDEGKIIITDELIRVSETAGYGNPEEYFCDSFVDYVKRKNIEPNLTADIASNFKFNGGAYFDDVFEYVLYGSVAPIDEHGLIQRLNFLQLLMQK